MAVKAVFPGTFDPITNGHLDILQRAATLFAHVTVAVAANVGKSPRLALSKRLQLVTQVTENYSNITVCSFDSLLIDLARAQGAGVIVRGLRATDFAYEAQLAAANGHLAPELETVFLIPTASNAFISSTIVREVASLGGDISRMVPPAVMAALHHETSTRS